MIEKIFSKITFFFHFFLDSGSLPGSPVTFPTSKPGQSPPALGPRPGSPSSPQPAALPSGQTSGQGNKPVATFGPQTGASSGGGTQTSTLNVGSLSPGQSRPGSPSSGYGSPTSLSSGNSPTPGSSPTAGKSWADVAGSGGNAKPASPTPAPRPGSLQPAGQPQARPSSPGQTNPAQPQPQARPAASPPGRTNPGQASGSGPGLRTGAAVAGGAAVAAGATTYSSNPVYSKGNGVTDDDLIKLSEALFIKDSNNANRYITLNLQKQATGSNDADQAPQP